MLATVHARHVRRSAVEPTPWGSDGNSAESLVKPHSAQFISVGRVGRVGRVGSVGSVGSVSIEKRVCLMHPRLVLTEALLPWYPDTRTRGGPTVGYM